MGCSCSKISNSIISSERDSKRYSKARDSLDIHNSGFVGMDKDNSYEISIRLENMILVEKDNMVDGSCYVAVYESRKMGKSNKRSFVLVGNTETITNEPNPEFIKRIHLINKEQDLRFEVYECTGSKHQNMNTNPMIGVFECNIKDLVDCNGYYTTPLEPVSIPMFGSIQVFAERIQEDRGCTTFSLSFTNMEMNPSNPYLVVSRINESGVRIPLYKSRIIGKEASPASNSPSPEEGESDATPTEPKSIPLLPLNEEDDKYVLQNITFDNQTLLNFEKNCQLSFELWEFAANTRDLYLGSILVPGTAVNTMYVGEQHAVQYNYMQMLEQRMKDSKVMKSNLPRVEAFKEYMEKHVNSVSACSLDMEGLEELKEGEHLLLAPMYTQDNSVPDKEDVGIIRVEEITTAFVNSFYDFQGITSLDFIIGVDMSSSLKTSGKSRNHDVEEALVDIGTVLSRYDEDDKYCVYGFGCQPEECVMSQGREAAVQIPHEEEAVGLELPSDLVGLDIHSLDIVEEVCIQEELSTSTSRSSSFHSIDSNQSFEMNEIPEVEIPIPEMMDSNAEVIEEAEKTEEIEKTEEAEAEQTEEVEKTEAEKTEEVEAEKVEEAEAEAEQTEEVEKTEDEKAEEVEGEKVEEADKPDMIHILPELNTSTRTKEEESLYRSQLFKSQMEADSLKRKRAESELRSRLELLKSHASPDSPTSPVPSEERTFLETSLFPLNGDEANPYIQSVDNILKHYYDVCQHSKPAYPTYFQHILQKGIERAKEAETTNGKEYIVLVVVSDCCIVDQVETTRLIVEASHLPLSMIIIGLGKNDFHFMELLDGDTKALTFNGKKAARDIVQFVSFEELRNKSCEEIISELMSELPVQFMDYMDSRGYTPENI